MLSVCLSEAAPRDSLGHLHVCMCGCVCDPTGKASRHSGVTCARCFCLHLALQMKR